MIVSINTEKVFETPVPFHNKSIQRARRETPSKGSKGIYEKISADIILNGLRLKTLLLRSRTKTRMPAFTTAVQHCTGSSNKKNWARKQKASKLETSKTISVHRIHDPIFRKSQRIHKKVTGANKSRKAAGYKINTHKPIMFLYISNKCFKK